MDRRNFLSRVPHLAAMGILAPHALAQTPAPVLQPLKYDGLGRLVRANTGKVILVDLWRHD